MIAEKEVFFLGGKWGNGDERDGGEKILGNLEQEDDVFSFDFDDYYDRLNAIVIRLCGCDFDSILLFFFEIAAPADVR